ncbi:hypothetical protein HYX03_02185 [Candidatus Woesearchaeota archaeon]|nr:hypothetical protein [Candidatus Woesearchaeota archaeon]
MITKTKSKDWVDALFQNVDELKSGDDDISWIFEFLGWSKYGKRGRRGTKSNW